MPASVDVLFDGELSLPFDVDIPNRSSADPEGSRSWIRARAKKYRVSERHELTRMAQEREVSPTPIDRYECCHDGCNSFVKQSTKIYVYCPRCYL